MPIFKPTSTDIQLILLQLEQATYNHDRWYEALVATLACRLPCDEHDVHEDAYRQCRFGQWLYGIGTEALQNHPSLPAIEAEHRRMHQQAGRLLMAAAEGTQVTVSDYDVFANALKGLRLEISTLQRELEGLQSSLDPLTGTSNRISMLTVLRDQQTLVKRRVMECALAMMDLDHFKSINDQHGHVAGDRVLTVVARYTMEHLRPYDKVFRYGGEEFVICMQNTGLETAVAVITRLCEGLASTPIYHNEVLINVTASFGVASLDPETSVEESVDRADKVMYAAKAAGRNCVRAATTEAQA